MTSRFAYSSLSVLAFGEESLRSLIIRETRQARVMSLTGVEISESPKKEFWNKATKYASAVSEDEPFVNEIAYMMVTLHRTGA